MLQISNHLSLCSVCFCPQMTALALTLLTFLAALPDGLQFEIAGVEVGKGRLLMKVYSGLTNGLRQSRQMPIASQSPEHLVNKEEDFAGDASTIFEMW